MPRGFLALVVFGTALLTGSDGYTHGSVAAAAGLIVVSPVARS